MRWLVLFAVTAFMMLSIGYGFYVIKVWLGLPNWTGLIILAATIWIAQWVAKEVDTCLF